ncbi:TolC family outer membrane protein [Aquitalea sp. LB_tupeE]|uniref:TolC family outer membrane protein n=1 Tax=Aquitalea sp. LB_tupeE TaxID=2748078 RepID=UPI0015B8CA56|nr:TolC family outer membrane protein [Aquitalea sp. LB_tupeE]NWK77282.1 TolC family outer membrane protein [Aquitalea sp. LB_tupeE]
MKHPARFTPLLPALALLLASTSSFAFDLSEAWQAARSYNSDYAGSRADLEAGRELAVQGRAQLLPQVGLTGSYSHTNPTQPAGQATYDSSGYGIQLAQPLFDISKYSAYQKGKIASQQADTSFGAAEQQLMVDIARAYFDVLLAEDTLTATRASKKAYQTQLQQAKTAFDLGTATIIDTHEAQAGFDAASAKEIVALNQQEISQNNLRRLTGLDPRAIQPLKAQLPPPPAGDLQSWLELATHNSLALRAAEQALQYASQTVTEKRGNQLPVVALNAGFNDNRSNQNGALPVTRGSSIGVSVSLPLFAGGGINSQIREALAKEESARDKLESTRRQLREDVRKSWLGVTNGAALVRAQQQLLVSAKSKVDSTKLGKEVGIRTNLDVLQAEQSYYDAMTSLATAKYDYLTARLQLEQVAGTLDEGRLQIVNAAIRH